MNRKSLLLRALRGPIMLITAGTLFALDLMTGIRFTSTWPVLIIMFGAMKLGESMAARTPDIQTGDR